MNKYGLYIKQAWISLRENPLAATFMLLGTTLAAAMLLVMAQFWHVRVAPYEPVSNRDRVLYVSGVMAVGMKADSTGQRVESGSRWMDSLGEPFAREVFSGLTSTEAVSISSADVAPVYVDTPGGGKGGSFDLRLTNDGFWHVFNPRLTVGRTFRPESVGSALREAVVTTEVARRLFGQIDAVGRILRVDFVEFTVVGVIEPISRVVGEVYGQIFVPYTCDERIVNDMASAGGICGPLGVCLLAPSVDSFPAIRHEIARSVAAYNGHTPEWEARLLDQPFTSTRRMFREWHQTSPGPLFSGMICLGGLFFFLPVFNLLGITSGLLRRRQSEIGLRKAFGATTLTVVGQMLCENLIVTVAGCLLGQALSILFFWMAKDGLMGQAVGRMSLDMFFSPWFFALSLVICLVINLLSTGIPAWRISRAPVMDALEEREGKS